MDINTTIKYYRNLRLDIISSLLPINMNDIKKAFLLKTINNKRNILKNVLDRVENQNHFLISMLQNDNPFSFKREISDNIIDAIDKYYELYLFISIENEFFYCLIEEDNFPKNKINRQLISFKKVKPFNYKLFFLNRRRIDN